MPKPAGFTALIANFIQDAGGNLLTGSLLVTPTDASDNPIDAVAGGQGGPIITPATFSFTAGVLAANSWVPTSPQTTNPNTSYRFTFEDDNGQILTVWTGVQVVSDSNGNFVLDTYQPILTQAQAVLSPGQSAYQIAVANGFSGTPSQWLASLQGQSAYQVWLAQGNTGTQAQFLASLVGPAGSATVASALSFMFSSAVAWIAQTVSTLNPKWLYAITDSVQRMLFGIDANGDTTVGGNLFAKFNLTVGGLFSGLKFTQGTDPRGALATLSDSQQRQIVRVLPNGVVQVNGGLSVQNGLSVNGPGPFTYNGQIVSAHAATSVIHVPNLGQSNQIGFSAENAVSGASKEGNLMLTGSGNVPSILPVGPRQTSFSGIALMQEVNIDSATYPVQAGSSAPGSIPALGDTGCVVGADARSRLYRAKFLGNQQYLYTIAAQGASTILNLYGSGMGPLATFAGQVVAAKAIFGAAYIAHWCNMAQGDADAGNASYIANVLTAVANLQAAYQTNSGNTNTLKILASQQSATPSGGSPNVMDTSLAWMTLAREYPTTYFVSGPVYARNTMIGSTQHIGPIGAIARALIQARIQYRYDFEGGTGNGLRFSSITRSGTLITIFFEVPVPPIVIDTEIVAAIANYGLEYSNTPPGAGTTPAITSVSTERPDGALAYHANAIYVVLSADPGAATNEVMRCAFTWPSGGDASLGTGARSNLRDSDKLLIEQFPDQVYANGSVGINPYNWACVDSMAVTVVSA